MTVEERVRPTRSGLFAIELVIAVGVFTLCAAICMGLFVRAETVSRRSADLNRAVSEARSAAECFKAAGGGLERTADLAGGAVEDGRVRVLYDQSWQRIGDCAAGAETVFLLEIAPLPAEGCAELRVLGPLEASSLLTEDAAGAEVLRAWRVAALEAIP